MFFGINFVPSMPPIPSHSDLHCHNGVSIFKYCSESFFNQVPNCIMQDVASNEEYLPFNCKLNCSIAPDEWDVICKNWQIKELCLPEYQKEYLQIETVVVKKEIIRLTECISFIMHNMTILEQKTGMYCPSDNQTNKILKSSCNVNCDDANVMQVISTSATDDQVKGSFQFWMFFAFLILSWIGMAVVVSVGDAICFGLLGEHPQKYGQQRMWGSIGWGIFSILSGFLIDKFSEGHIEKNYSVGFYMVLIIIAFDVFVSTKIKVDPIMFFTFRLKFT